MSKRKHEHELDPVAVNLFVDDPETANVLAKEFLAFHRDNPHVYHELRRLALHLQARGRKHYGIGGLFEVLRWQRAMETTDHDFKLNNDHRAFYARLLMAKEPLLKGFFATRVSWADRG